MSVIVEISGSFDREVIEGDLLTLVHNLNTYSAQGKQFALLDGENGPVMIQAKLITKAREESDDALIGG